MSSEMKEPGNEVGLMSGQVWNVVGYGKAYILAWNRVRAFSAAWNTPTQSVWPLAGNIARPLKPLLYLQKSSMLEASSASACGVSTTCCLNVGESGCEFCCNPWHALKSLWWTLKGTCSILILIISNPNHPEFSSSVLDASCKIHPNYYQAAP